MPLAGKKEPEDNAAALKAKKAFDKLDKLKGLQSTTETLSCRVPKGEKERLRLLFARQGLTLAQGVKKAVYEYAATLKG